MSDTDFLIRNAFGDTGTIPRSGAWTSCPDILPYGQQSLLSQEMISSYDDSSKYVDQALQVGSINNIYVRSKNTNAADTLSTNVYLFQVAQSLFLRPILWYTEGHLINYSMVQNGSVVNQNYQTITAGPNQVTATDAFQWTPDDQEHHCLITVLGSSFDDIGHYFPPDINDDMNAYAAWIYNNRNIGWHNVHFEPVVSNIMQTQAPLTGFTQDQTYTFVLTAFNVPVGAKINFFASNTTASDVAISTAPTVVQAQPGQPNQTVVPSFGVNMVVSVQKGYESVITYQTDFGNMSTDQIPDNFRMSFKANLAADQAVVAANFADVSHAQLFRSAYSQAFSPSDEFFVAETGKTVRGVGGLYEALHFNPNHGHNDPITPTIPVTVGSYTSLHKTS